MKKSAKRQATESSKPKPKKTRSDENDAPPNIPLEDSPVSVHYIDYKNNEDSVPSIPLNPDLDTLLYPMTASTFLEHSLRQRAVHITCQKGFEEVHGTTRVAELLPEMCHLNARSILQETSSDTIFLWLRRRQDEESTAAASNNKATSNSKEDLIQSVEISDVETAIALHKTAGHATYCRAPPKVEQSLVSSLLRATGLGCGQYDPSGESMVSMARGEVETFISSPGHVTNWHFDFQENFTIQLSGIKRWTIQQGTIRDPIRGCTPHYAAPEAVESQLKAAHLFDRKFRFGHPETGVNALGKVVSIDVKPGDVFYFPAGMWHKVETIVPGVSINVSLMANNYATVVSQAIQQFLLQYPQWRKPVLQNSASNMVQDLNKLLKELPTRLQQLSNAESIIPPALQYAPIFHAIDDGDIDEESTTDPEIHNAQETGDNGSDDEDGEVESTGGDDEEGAADGTEEDIVAEENEVMDPREFDYPVGWDIGFKAGTKTFLQRNPLAILHRMDEISSFYRNGREGSDSETLHDIFVLNVNFVGNEMHQSAVRVIFCDSEEGFVNRLYSELEGSTARETELVVSPQELPFVKFLIYYGYISPSTNPGIGVKSQP
jgi:hypothetical protein